jgi:predicted transcriptional regulator
VTLRTGQSDFAVFDRGYLVGVLTRDEAAGGFQRYGANVSVGRIMRTDIPTARPGDSLCDLHHEMERSGSKAVSVVENGRFLGLATLESGRRALQCSTVWQGQRAV